MGRPRASLQFLGLLRLPTNAERLELGPLPELRRGRPDEGGLCLRAPRRDGGGIVNPLVSFVLGLALGAFFAGVLFKRRLRKIRQAIEPLPDRLAEEVVSASLEDGPPLGRGHPRRQL